MTLQTSGAISLNDVQTEFGGSNPISISEYYGVGGGAGASQPIGLSPALFTVSGNNAIWVNRSINVSAYSGHTVRPVFLHTGMTNFQSDLQLDNIGFGTNLYTFSANAIGWETSGSGNQAAYASSTFLGISSTRINGRWCRDQGGTSSSGTGLTTDAAGSTSGWYLYTETTQNFASANKYWLRGPATLITGSNNTFNFSEARYGSAMGTLTAYLDVTAQPGGGTPASGTISLSDFYGLSKVLQTMNGVSGTIATGYYPVYGYRLSIGGSISTSTSSYNNNVGSLSNSTDTPSGRRVLDVRRYANPGFTGMTIYMDGSQGNAGWTRCDWSNAAGTSTGFFNRAECVYTAITPGATFTATAKWDVGTGYGGSGSTFTGAPPYQFISGAGQNFTLTFS
jgi:hypothetical protein